MTPKNLYLIMACAVFCLVSCTQQDDLRPETTKTVLTRTAGGNGATQISGVGEFAGEECDVAGEGAYFALSLTGDLEGCLFVFVEEYECTPSGVYIESGQEYFEGTYNGEYGTFWTTYKFEAKYEDCENLLGEIFGRCQHPIQDGSGTGVFEGVSGRLDFKDEVETATFPYRGHLRY